MFDTDITATQSTDITARGIVDMLALELDSNADRYAYVLGAACRAVRDDSGYPELSAEDYAMAVRDREAEFYGPVGLAVRDALLRLAALDMTGDLDGIVPAETFTGSVILSTVKFPDIHLYGERWTPDADQYAEWCEDTTDGTDA